MSGWDRGDAAEWAPVLASSVQIQRENAAELARLERSGWDRADAAEWAKPSEPRLPAVRVRFVVLAFVLIVLAGVVGIVGSIPGAFNGASLAAIVLGGAGIGIIVREVRR